MSPLQMNNSPVQVLKEGDTIAAFMEERESICLELP